MSLDPKRPLQDSLQRIPTTYIIVGGVLAVILVLGGVFAAQALFPGNQPQAKPPVTAAPPTPTAVKTTPQTQSLALLFGTNLGLFNASDQFLTSAPTLQTMQQLHIKVIRIPTRKDLPDSVNMAVARNIKSVGAIPVIALRGAQDPNIAQVTADDIRMINVMNQVFGDAPVYYEFGNEDDWNGVEMAQYVQRWNALIPQFKKLAPKAHFVGPVLYQYSAKNLTEFLQGANPRPDEISWHEYTCSYKSTATKCLSSLDKWTTHIEGARQVMQSTIQTTLPIMITEWNYAPDQKVGNNGQAIDDGKYNNDAFMKEWTTKAMNILAREKVFASMQYSVTNTAIPMISPSNTITNQGATFKTLYEQMVK